MKPSAFLNRNTALVLTVLCMIGTGAFLPETSRASLAKKNEEKNTAEPVAVIVRYQVKSDFQNQFQKTLRDYVTHAEASEQNIMAEAFSEPENPSVFWVIERWRSRSELTKSHSQSSFMAIEKLSLTALEQPVKTIYVKDLEPISKSDWRTFPRCDDSPFVVMLFVDSKPGMEENFKAVYHKAMPAFRGEPGVICYQLSQLEGDNTQFVTYEKFRDEDAFQYHLKFPPIAPVIEFLTTSIKEQPFQAGLHRLVMIP